MKSTRYVPEEPIEVLVVGEGLVVTNWYEGDALMYGVFRMEDLERVDVPKC